MRKSSLKLDIESLPEALRQEVADFVAFLKMKHNVQGTNTSREFGYAKGKIKLSKDFDEPLDSFKEYQ